MQPYLYALVAQSVEHLTFNQRAWDSSSHERTKNQREIVRFLVGFSVLRCLHGSMWIGTLCEKVYSLEPSDKESQSYNRQHRPGNVPACYFPFGWLRTVCIADTKGQIETEQFVCK